MQKIINTNIFFIFRTKGIMGKEVTPYILQRLNEITEGASLTASILDLSMQWWKSLTQKKICFCFFDYKYFFYLILSKPSIVAKINLGHSRGIF